MSRFGGNATKPLSAVPPCRTRFERFAAKRSGLHVRRDAAAIDGLPLRRLPLRRLPLRVLPLRRLLALPLAAHRGRFGRVYDGCGRTASTAPQ
jgi:hypothetical protein